MSKGTVTEEYKDAILGVLIKSGHPIMFEDIGQILEKAGFRERVSQVFVERAIAELIADEKVKNVRANRSKVLTAGIFYIPAADSWQIKAS